MKTPSPGQAASGVWRLRATSARPCRSCETLTFSSQVPTCWPDGMEQIQLGGQSVGKWQLVCAGPDGKPKSHAAKVARLARARSKANDFIGAIRRWRRSHVTTMPSRGRQGIRGRADRAAEIERGWSSVAAALTCRTALLHFPVI